MTEPAFTDTMQIAIVGTVCLADTTKTDGDRELQLPSLA